MRKEREEAWIGDAVLDLFARRYILASDGAMDASKLSRLTSNQFLSCIANPTSVEAKIGRRFQEQGLDAAFALIEEELVPLFLKQEKNRQPSVR